LRARGEKTMVLALPALSPVAAPVAGRVPPELQAARARLPAVRAARVMRFTAPPGAM
jgi:hypothetical protein